jgi:hypothetical protein
MDCDGDVDFDDIDDFVLGLNDPVQYTSHFGVPPSLKGDTDGDQDIDFDDIPGFVTLLGGGAQAGLAVPEPSHVGLLLTAALATMIFSKRIRQQMQARCLHHKS